MAEPNKRRHFLRAVGAGVLTGIAGCSSQPDNGGEEPSGDGSGPDDGSGGGGGDLEPVPSIEMMGFTRQLAPPYVEVQLLCKQMMEELGVTIEINTLEIGALFERFNNHDFQMSMMNWIARPERLDPSLFLDSYFHSQYLDGSNYAEYNNPEYDEVADGVNTSLDMEERQEYVYQAQEILARDVPNLFLFHTDSLNAINTSDYTNWNAAVGTYPYWNVWGLGDIEPSGDSRQVIWGTGLEPPTVNIMGVNSNTGMLGTKMVYDRLIKIGPQADPRPWAATEWEVVDDTTIDVTLRDDMTFHDGEPVTAEDVKFSMDYLVEWGQPYFESAYRSVEGVELPDSNVVRYNLTEPFAPFVYVTLSQVPILPKHIWDGVVDENGLDHPSEWSELDLTGSGPFKLADFTQSERLLYEKYDGHFTEYDVETLIWRIYGSNTAAVGDVESGRTTLAQDLPASLFSDVQDRGEEGVLANAVPTHLWAALVVKNTERPFDDLAFRKALSHVIDRQQIVDIVFQGNAQPASSPIAPANEFWYNGDVPLDNGGVEKARSLLEEAGYDWDGDGNLLMPSG